MTYYIVDALTFIILQYNYKYIIRYQLQFRFIDFFCTDTSLLKLLQI